ncbi:unnamed protein product, partial [Phaeothamnion confervicola]
VLKCNRNTCSQNRAELGVWRVWDTRRSSAVAEVVLMDVSTQGRLGPEISVESDSVSFDTQRLLLDARRAIPPLENNESQAPLGSGSSSRRKRGPSPARCKRPLPGRTISTWSACSGVLGEGLGSAVDAARAPSSGGVRRAPAEGIRDSSPEQRDAGFRAPCIGSPDHCELPPAALAAPP